MNPAVKKLKEHVDACPVGWVGETLVHGRWTSMNEIVQWLKTLKDLSDKVEACACENACTQSGHHLNCPEHWVHMNQFGNPI